MFIDTHAHLNFKDFEDIDEVVTRSLQNGVEKIICVSSNISDSVASVEVARKYKGTIFAAVGIHPQCTDPENADSIKIQLEKLEKLVMESKEFIVAIGECGLDSTRVGDGERERSESDQEELFIGQINLAKKYDLPILLHFNKAHDIFLEKYSDLKNMRGIFHFYAGGKKRLGKFLEFNDFLFGIAGPVTYDEGLQQVAKEIPLERIVLETDCPFLAPLPHRGERNEPSYIPLIAAKIAEIKNTSLEEVEDITTKNAQRLFKI